jgi:hypothetical protein
MVFSSSAASILAGLVLLVTRAGRSAGGPPPQPKQADEPRNLIDNGDFEDSDAGAMYARHDKEEPPPGWTVKRGTVDVIGGWWQAAHGKQSLDLNGLEPGAISQEVATEPGKTYVLSFWMAGNPDDPEPRRTAIEIAWDKKVVRTVVFDRKPEHTHKSMGWTQHETRLRATGSARASTSRASAKAAGARRLTTSG